MNNMTISSVAREVGVCAQTIRAYADAGLIPCERDSVGRRLFSAASVVAAKEVLNSKRTAIARREELRSAA